MNKTEETLSHLIAQRDVSKQEYEASENALNRFVYSKLSALHGVGVAVLKKNLGTERYRQLVNERNVSLGWLAESVFAIHSVSTKAIIVIPRFSSNRAKYRIDIELLCKSDREYATEIRETIVPKVKKDSLVIKNAEQEVEAARETLRKAEESLAKLLKV